MSKQTGKPQRGKAFSPTLDRLKALQEPVHSNVNWDGLDPEECYRLLSAVNRAGGSIMFGATRDRGAWVVTIWHPQLGDKGKPEYCNSREMLPDFVTDLANMWETVAEEITGSRDT